MALVIVQTQIEAFNMLLIVVVFEVEGRESETYKKIR